jgi:hypothetical protein
VSGELRPLFIERLSLPEAVSLINGTESGDPAT